MHFHVGMNEWGALKGYTTAAPVIVIIIAPTIQSFSSLIVTMQCKHILNTLGTGYTRHQQWFTIKAPMAGVEVPRFVNHRQRSELCTQDHSVSLKLVPKHEFIMYSINLV